jgi:hypothetical protein
LLYVSLQREGKIVIKKIRFVFLSLLLFAGLAGAQVPTSGNVFFGYSYYSTDVSSSSHYNLNGWEGSVEAKVFRWVGVVADLSGHYGQGSGANGCPPESGSGCTSSNVPVHEYNALFGPRVSVSVGKVRPFAEAMFGMGHFGGNSLLPDTEFATAIGGGVDYKIIRPIGLRFEGDYVQTRFFGPTQNNVRLSTGIVLRF